MTTAPRPQAEIPSVKGLLVLDGDGKRIVARYYSSHFASSTDELAFEKKLFDKTARTNAKTEGAATPHSPTPPMPPLAVLHHCLLPCVPQRKSSFWTG